MRVAELDVVHQVLARPVVVGRHGVVSIVPVSNRPVHVNMAVSTRNNAGKSISADSSGLATTYWTISSSATPVACFHEKEVSMNLPSGLYNLMCSTIMLTES